MYVVTGGCGFIGSHIVSRLLHLGADVIVFDNLSRRGSELNLRWLREQGRFEFVQGDLRDHAGLRRLLEGNRNIRAVFHQAAQVAVTTSVENPRLDFESNALGTFNLLEAIRESGVDCALLFASTNKVYGELPHVKVVESNGRYVYAEGCFGIDEREPLDFHSPYGCSKGCADQYVRDYSRLYGLKSVVFRQSCIYGTRQFGVEDQGWIAWFAIAAVLGLPVNLYGDGKQVRDALFVDDLVDLYLTALNNMETCAGQVYNVGGGPENTLSLLELLSMLERRTGRPLSYTVEDWRPGDQKVFVGDIRKVQRELGWQPTVAPEEGVQRLLDWVEANREMLGETAHH